MAEPGTRMFALFGPLVLLGLLMLALRWTFGTGAKHGVPRPADPNDPTGDGLLTEVTRVPTAAAAELLRARLDRADIRATVGRSDGQFRLLVFTEQVVDAKLVLRGPDP